MLLESPSLISVEEIRGNSSPLVAAVQEFGLPGSGSTDIVAFSTTGDMAVVECKLAANAEIKRKVIGQVLEYGAYLWGMSYASLDETVRARTGKNLADLVRESVGDPDWDEESFRATVEETLSQGSFILIIAVDEINDELARTIRFLNGCGNPAFAFTSLELRRFQTQETKTPVPNLIGLAQSRPSKPTGSRVGWTEETFFEAMGPGGISRQAIG